MQTATPQHPGKPTEAQVLRFGAGLTGVVLTLSSVLAADQAAAHMQAIGAICGAGPAPHCGWCIGAASLVLAGFAAFAYAARPAAELQRV